MSFRRICSWLSSSIFALFLLLTSSVAVFASGKDSFVASSTSLPVTSFPVNSTSLSALDSSSKGWLDALSYADWEFASIFGGILYLGVAEWDWGSASFKFQAEGWFGMDRGSGGADKLGHLYSSYVIDEFLTNAIYKDTGDYDYAAKYGAIFSWGLMMFVEVFDGYSSDHGFSYEDVIMNTTGIGISYLKNTIPGLQEKLDLRIEYHPSKGVKGFHPVTDYTGLRYLAALRMSGFESLKNTPFRFFEFHLGYRARGFKKEDAPYFAKREAEVYTGIGLNLSELLFRPAKKRWNYKAFDYADTLTRYYQVPGTYVATDIHEREGKRRD